MKSLILTEIKKNFYSYLSISLVAFGWKLVGIAGVIGSAIICYGLKKTIENSNYSKNKKIVYSVLYCVGGVIISFIIAMALAMALAGFFGGNIYSKTNVEEGYRVPQGYQVYKNPKTVFSALTYPNNWTVEEYYDEYETLFESPDKERGITASFFYWEDEENIDLKTYTSKFFTEQALKQEPLIIKFEKIHEQIKKIHGKDWLIYDSIIHYGDSRTVARIYHNRTAIVATGEYDNRQHVQLLLESDKDHFQSDAAIFDTMIESARFYGESEK